MKLIYPKKFSNSRNKIILEKCTGKKILHIGACDAPFTKSKYDGNKGPLLYREIDNICSEQLGIDLDTDSINFLNSKDDFKNSKVIYFDMNKLEQLDFQPDIIIFGEVIEHLMNLEIALTNIKKVMNDETILLITTPNCFHIGYFINTLFGYEQMHEDHKVFFSYGYLKNLLKFNNLLEIDFYFTNLDLDGSINIFGKTVRLFTKIFTSFSDTLLMVVKKEKNN